jgi:putative methyltransferase (TIGR04325 family)
MGWREILKDLSPPLLWRFARAARRRGLRFAGDYSSWQDAKKASVGYDSDAIARRVLEAELKVKRGEAADARDGVAFDEMQFSFPVMAALARLGHQRAGGLHVVDLGGAFGSLYRHFKAFVPHAHVRWTVVEQPAFVRLGHEHFANDELRFVDTLDEALKDGTPDIVALSSVLQYLPNPHDTVRRLAQAAVPHIVVDRTPCSGLDRDILAVQQVPAEIYAASYPCWILSRARLLDCFGPDYAVLGEFADTTGQWHCDSVRFEFAGFMLDRVT